MKSKVVELKQSLDYEVLLMAAALLILKSSSSEAPRSWQLLLGDSLAVAYPWWRVKLFGGEPNSLAASQDPWRRVELLGICQAELSPGGLGMCEGGRNVGL